MSVNIDKVQIFINRNTKYIITLLKEADRRDNLSQAVSCGLLNIHVMNMYQYILKRIALKT